MHRVIRDSERNRRLVLEKMKNPEDLVHDERGRGLVIKTDKVGNIFYWKGSHCNFRVLCFITVDINT